MSLSSMHNMESQLRDASNAPLNHRNDLADTVEYLVLATLNAAEFFQARGSLAACQE